MALREGREQKKSGKERKRQKNNKGIGSSSFGKPVPERCHHMPLWSATKESHRAKGRREGERETEARKK